MIYKWQWRKGQTMKQVKGNLITLALAGEFDVIIHGCNCFCTMGAGIARQIRDTFPQAYEADQTSTPGDRKKLGSYTQARVNPKGNPLFIINGYTQYHYEGDGVLADYDAIDTLFRQLKAKFKGQRFGYPKIGAGLANGNWETIAKIIDRTLEGENHTLVVFNH